MMFKTYLLMLLIMYHILQKLWFGIILFIVADLDTTGVVAGFGITITNLYSSGDPVRGDPEAAD